MTRAGRVEVVSKSTAGSCMAWQCRDSNINGNRRHMTSDLLCREKSISIINQVHG